LASPLRRWQIFAYPMILELICLRSCNWHAGEVVWLQCKLTCWWGSLIAM
jgi:hypothetical protein